MKHVLSREHRYSSSQWKYYNDNIKNKNIKIRKT